MEQEKITIIAGGVLAIYEVMISIIPTAKSWSLLTNAMRLIRIIVKDKKIGGGTHTA